MARTSWKNSTSPSEIMELIQDSKTVDKFNVLAYFGQNQKDLEMLEKLLKSGYYTPEEIASRKPQAYTGWTYAPAREMLLEFANKSWQSLDNAEEIIKMRVGLIPSEIEDFQAKLKYFEKRNTKLYIELWRLSTKQDFMGIVDYVNHLMKNAEENKDEIVDILARHTQAIPRVKVVGMDLREAIERRRIQIARVKDWRNETNAQLIMYKATPENKWEIFEYFANNDEKIFKAIVYGYATKAENPVKRMYSRNEILERYSNVDLDTLPECLKNYILSLKQSIIRDEELKKQRQEERAQAKEEKLLSWEDEAGSTIALFKVGSITPKSKDDYEKVLKKYLDENLGITAFCSKYKISDVKGFKTMLEKFSAENSTYAEQIESKSNQQQAKYVDKVRDIIEGVCVEGEPIESIIKYSKTFSFEKLQDLARRLFPDKNYCEILTIKVIEYYHNRLNSYTNSIEPENISNMLTIDEIRFIVGDEEYTSMMTGKKCEIEKVFLKRVSFLNATQSALIRQKVNSQRPDSIIKAIAKYDTKFKQNEYFRSTTFILAENGEQVEVTREMVDMAYKYAYSKKLHTSDAVMRYLIKAVVNGKIQNMEETKQDRKAMMRQAMALVSEITNIDEYFTAVDNLHQ